MLRRLVYAVLFVVLMIGTLRQQIAISDLQNQPDCILTWQLPSLISRVTPSVVYVEATVDNDYDDYQCEIRADWNGSGVIIGPHMVLTAGHIIEDGGEFRAMTVDGEWHAATMWVQHPDIDYGFLFFEEELEPVAKFADSDKIKIGDRIVVIGSPYGKDLFNTVTAGIISGLSRDIPFFGEALVITTDAASNPGNSGGPVFDMQGRIIGILVGGIHGADGFGVLIPANVCKEFYEEVESETN